MITRVEFTDSPPPGPIYRQILSLLCAAVICGFSPASHAAPPFRSTDCDGSAAVSGVSSTSSATSSAPLDLASLHANAPYRDDTRSEDAARIATVRQSALSLGMRAGFNRGIWCERQEIEHRTTDLDKMYDFRVLLFEAGGGFLFEPGTITEEFNNRTVTDDGTKAAAAVEHISLPVHARLVSRARDWRQYLIVDTEPLAPEHPSNRPTEDDKPQWDRWVDDGWQRGLRQAHVTMDLLWAQLDRDYLGMVDYRRMVLEGRIDPPRTLVTDRGVTGNEHEVRVGDVAVETRVRDKLQPDTARWRPLPFMTSPSSKAEAQ